MNNALIGYSGFVGSTLLRQTHFAHQYRSSDIHTIRGQNFGTLVCAGAPAEKWLANKDPKSDEEKINSLIEHLSYVDCKTFILISTVDVFKAPIDVDESSNVETDGLHAYGLNRYKLEQFVQSRFENALIVRLPGLVGPGLKKNIIFDLHNNNNLEQVESRNVFQFYPMVNLWYDIQIAIANGIKLLHLTAQPISVEDVASFGFDRPFINHKEGLLIKYNFKSQFAHFYGGVDYQYSKIHTVQAIRHYCQSEPRR